jgi:NhaP-type Na+/H+ or K+/H+ antiporter
LSSYIVIITVIGLAALGMAWMPSLSKKLRISYAIIYVALGMLVYLALGRFLPLPDPISRNHYTVRLTELTVIISLMGTGLKIDQPFSFRTWAVPLRMVSFTMLLCIAAVAWIGIHWLNLSPAAAILLGAALAPTDPVLASDVQVGPPMEPTKDNVKFSLTAEAGMNDGTAFPFTWLAVAFAAAGSGEVDWSRWVWDDLLYKIVAGVVVGYLTGRAIAFLAFRMPQKVSGLETRDGFVAIAATLVVYGLTEMIHGYGFIAVFIAAITIRHFEPNHKFHKRLHEFTDQMERILIAVVLLLFGGSLVSGILGALTWELVGFALVFVLLIRPATSLLGMIATRLKPKEKWVIAFFGIRGMGSFFYLAFALQEERFVEQEALWSVVAFVVLLSIVVHGLSAGPVMEQVDIEFSQTITKEDQTKKEA